MTRCALVWWSIWTFLVQECNALCGPARCESGCANNATFVAWQQGVALNASVGEGDVLAILVDTATNPVEVRSPCDGVVASMQDVKDSQIIAFGAVLAVISPPGVPLSTTTLMPPSPEECSFPSLPHHSGDVVVRVEEPCSFTGFLHAQGDNIRMGSPIATCVRLAGDEVKRDTPVNVLSGATGSIAALQPIALYCHVQPSHDLAVITVGEWNDGEGAGGHPADQDHGGSETTREPDASTEPAPVEKVTAIVRTVTASTAAPKLLVKLGLAPGQKLEAAPSNTSFVAWMRAVGQVVKTGTPLVKLTQEGDGKEVVVQASIDGVVASQQPSLRPGDKVPAGTDLITITEMAAVTTPSPSGTQGAMPASTTLRGSSGGITAQSSAAATGTMAEIDNGNFAPPDWSSIFRENMGRDEMPTQSAIELRSAFCGTFVAFYVASSDRRMAGDTLALIKTDTGVIHMRAPTSGTVDVLRNLSSGAQLSKGDVLLTVIPENTEASYPADETGTSMFLPLCVIQLLVLPLLLPPLLLCCGLLTLAGRNFVREYEHRRHVASDKVAEAESERLLFAGVADVPESGRMSEDKDGEKVREIVDAGFTEAQARQALADARGDLDVALEALLVGGSAGSVATQGSKVRELVDAGFTEAQARKALADAGGNIDEALEALLTTGSARSSPSTALSAVAELCDTLGCTEEQARRALRNAKGDREAALNALLEGSRSSYKGSEAPAAQAPPPLGQPRSAAPTEEGKVAQLVDAGFAPDRARQALRDCGGNVEDAMLALLATRSESSKASKASAAKHGGLSISEDDKVAKLVEAGFDADAARQALRRTNGDVEEAMMALISESERS